jgi:hypothetical protein
MSEPKTIAEKVLHSWYHNWSKHIDGGPARPVPLEVFLEYQLQEMTRLEFLRAISEAIEERLSELGQ